MVSSRTAEEEEALAAQLSPYSRLTANVTLLGQGLRQANLSVAAAQAAAAAAATAAAAAASAAASAQAAADALAVDVRVIQGLLDQGGR